MRLVSTQMRSGVNPTFQELTMPITSVDTPAGICATLSHLGFFERLHTLCLDIEPDLATRAMRCMFGSMLAHVAPRLERLRVDAGQVFQGRLLSRHQTMRIADLTLVLDHHWPMLREFTFNPRMFADCEDQCVLFYTRFIAVEETQFPKLLNFIEPRLGVVDNDRDRMKLALLVAQSTLPHRIEELTLFQWEMLDMRWERVTHVLFPSTSSTTTHSMCLYLNRRIRNFPAMTGLDVDYIAKETVVAMPEVRVRLKTIAVFPCDEQQWIRDIKREEWPQLERFVAKHQTGLSALRGGCHIFSV